jgi:hypothetical protein
VFKAQIVTQCRASLNIRQRIEHAKHEVEALPFLAEWFVTLRRIKSCTTTRVFMVVVALQFAFVRLLRFSEFCVTAEDHFVRACDIKFVMKHPASPDGLWILPEDAHSFPLSDLIACFQIMANCLVKPCYSDSAILFLVVCISIIHTGLLSLSLMKVGIYLIVRILLRDPLSIRFGFCL